jgi:formylglycine-generating enzyme required for sulfatase activity
MAETFTVDTWKSQIADWWKQTARDLPGAMQRLGVRTAYGLLTASAFVPLLAAYTGDPGKAVTALVSLVGSVGTNLLSNILQGAYDKTTAPTRVERELAERAELRPEYQQLLNSLNVLAAAQAALGDQWNKFATRLDEELRQLGGSLRIESGGGAVVLGDVSVPFGDFIGGDKIEFHYHAGPPAPDLTSLRQAYLRHIVSRCERLPLRGMDIGAGDPSRAERLRLAQVYVDLDTTASALHGTVREARTGKRADFMLSDESTQAVEHVVVEEGRFLLREQERISALDAARLEQHVVLLGAPGSGKSTFIGHLTFCLAMNQLDPAGNWLAHLVGWPGNEANVLPVVVTLRDFARWATTRKLAEANASALMQFLEQWLADRDLQGFVEPLRQALRGKSQALVLCDGLDEIPGQDLRALVRDAVAGFARTYDGARLVVTCRTLSYQDARWQLPADQFPTFELAPFDEDKIDRFITAWYHELAELGAVRGEDASALANKLRQAVRRPDLWRLAPNPLLLTVMALVHAYRGRLPEARALLYEECTDLLLWRWESVKLQAERDQPSGLRALLLDAGLQDIDLKRTLWALAFDAHRTGGSTDNEATADIAQAALLRVLHEIHPQHSWDWANAVVQQIKERAGLLVERDVEVYSFPHRTFQEYLAACHLSVQTGFAQQAAALASEATFWREVVLLAVGRQVHVMGDLDRTLTLVPELCSAESPASDAGWRAAWLAGEVLLETGANRATQLKLGREMLERVRARLVELVEGGHLTARERAEAGDVLGQLGDPRFDPPAFFLPRTYRGKQEPFAGFIEIPAGPFMMGSRKGDKEANDDEFGNPDKLTIPYVYWIARYPTTVAQYQVFVEAKGYEEPAWWTPMGWNWRQGQWDSTVQEGYLRDWLRRRPAEQRNTPMWWSEQAYANRPVYGVCWFEAMAYCQWLDAQLRQKAKLPTGYQVRLPTEAEWEKAARSDDARRYPWGNRDWDEEKANISPSEINRPTCVGMYPRGASSNSVYDLCGNLWEWCLSLYKPYPYNPHDGRNALEAEEPRVLRGGSWFDVQRLARCASRYRDIPGDWYNYIGFRVVLSLAEF